VIADAAAVVFDCDGLLLETESRWTIAEQALVRGHGGTWTTELKWRMLGMSLSQAAHILADWLGLEPAAAPALAVELEAEYASALAEHGAEPMPGALALLDALAGRVPLAVASNTPEPHLGAALRAGGLPDVFAAVVGSGGELRPKPAPDVYLAACRALAVDPAAALAFEDSQPGCDAARAAGLRVVGVPSLPGQVLRADVQLASLEHALP
jgi:HAD superfamily hydrolase (TIGR01509 family)